LIHGQTQTRIIDSKHGRAGFDNCVFAMQQRVLQHNQGVSRHRAEMAESALMTQGGHRQFLLLQLRSRFLPYQSTRLSRYDAFS
jgi:hypothetical protein